jgi:hypothetical protein
MKRKTQLEYACWKIISKYQDIDKETVDGLRFNKMMSLLNNKLLIAGLDIELPRYWYFFGEIVVPKELPTQVRFEGADEEETKAVFKWSGDAPKRPPMKDKRKINSIVDSIYSKFPPAKDIFDVVDEVYKYAPYEYQRAYKDFRSEYSLKSMVDVEGIFRAKSLYLNSFNKAMQYFPYKDFPELRVPAKKLECVVKAVFKEFPEQNKIGIEMCVKFWEIFCKFLRVSDKGHMYVSNEHVVYWRENLQNDFESYKKDLLSRTSAVLSDFHLKTLQDPLLIAFLQSESLGKNFRNLSSEIDKAVYG